MIRNILLISTLGVLLASIYMPLTYCLRRLTSSSVVQQHNSKTKHQRCIRMPDAGPPLILAYDLHQVWSSAIQNTDHHYPGKPKWAYVLVPSCMWPEPHKMAWLTETSEKHIHVANTSRLSKSGTLPGKEAKDWMDMHLNYSLLILDSQEIRLSFTRVPGVRRD